MTNLVDQKYYEAIRPRSIGERILVQARTRSYADFINACKPGPDASIIDIGVSDVVTDGANILEQLYPAPHRITAAGLGEGQAFRRAFPLVTYERISPGAALPFADQSFEIATANAVLEHVGGREQQERFILELVRVARQVYVTVPNRFFPVEHHTAIPFLHYWNPSFKLACGMLGKGHWAQQANLLLMTLGSLKQLAPEGRVVKTGFTGLPMGWFSSNLFLHIKRVEE